METAVQIRQLKWQGCVHLLLKSCERREWHLPQNAAWSMAIISSPVWGWSLSVHGQTIVTGTGPLPDPENLLLSTPQTGIVWEDTCADKAKDFIGKESPGGEQQGRGTRENCSAMWLAVTSFKFMVSQPVILLVLVFGLTQVLHGSAHMSQPTFWRKRFWEVGRHYGLISFLPFDPAESSRFSLLAATPCLLLESPVVR